MDLKETLELLKLYPNISFFRFEPGKTIELSFFEPKAEAEKMIEQAQPMQFGETMPPDDVMLFAATEDIDELMKQRIAKPPAEV